jgi:DNA-binding NarL/FixJ family response regulator
MQSSGNLEIKQVQAMLRLVGETAELWYDAMLQRRYTLESLCRLLPAKAGVCFNFGDVLTGGETACVNLTQIGLAESDEESVAKYLRSGKPSDPCIPALAREDLRVAVRRRAELCDDQTWRSSEHFQLLRQALGLNDTLYARIAVPARMIVLCLFREKDDKPFAERECQLVDLCLSQMAWPYQPDDAPADPRVAALQPRLRKVMQHLLEGDAEKQVAAKLGLSKHTVHEYVKMIYQQLGVSSRSELLSQWVGRM